MPEPARQLVLDLPLDPSFGREDFLVGRSNAVAFALIERWPDWTDTVVVLRGPAGSGKSHLAAIWAAKSGARILEAASIQERNVPELAATAALAIEDLDRKPLDEPALFHLVNLSRERHVPILFTGTAALDQSAIRLPDLLSRLRLAPSIELGPPDDTMLRAVLVKLFADRQLLVETNVLDYLVRRIERSFAAVAAVVSLLDQEALSRGQRVTRAIAAAVVGDVREEPEDE